MTDERLHLLGFFDDTRTDEERAVAAARMEYQARTRELRRNERIAGAQAWLNFLMKRDEDGNPINMVSVLMGVTASLVAGVTICASMFFVMFCVDQVVSPFGTWSKGFRIYESDLDVQYNIIDTLQGTSDWRAYTPWLKSQEAITFQEELRKRYPYKAFRLRSFITEIPCWYVGEELAFSHSPYRRSECFSNYRDAVVALIAFQDGSLQQLADIIDVEADLELSAPTTIEVLKVPGPTEYVILDPEIHVIVVPEEEYYDGVLFSSRAETHYTTEEGASDLANLAEHIYYVDGVE